MTSGTFDIAAAPSRACGAPDVALFSLDDDFCTAARIKFRPPHVDRYGARPGEMLDLSLCVEQPLDDRALAMLLDQAERRAEEWIVELDAQDPADFIG